MFEPRQGPIFQKRKFLSITYCEIKESKPVNFEDTKFFLVKNRLVNNK